MNELNRCPRCILRSVRCGVAMVIVISLVSLAGIRARAAAAGDAGLADTGTTAAGTGTPQPDTTLEEITVTAQKRVQSIQDVSISMAAYTDQEIKQLGMYTVADLAKYTPNVSFSSFFSVGKPDISIRGYSIGALFTDFEQAPVGIYNDDVYMGSRSGQLSQMFDLERVEVLRGPQGTLFGRNTSAGAISFISKKPSDQFEADADVTYGRWNEVDVDAGMTMPISDTLSVRVAGIKMYREGWQFNVNPAADGERLDNVDNWGARVLVQWKPTSDMTWLLNVHGSGNDTKTPVVHADLGSTGVNAPNIYTGYLAPPEWNVVASNSPIYEILHAHGASLDGNVGLGAMTLTSISAYERVDYSEAEDDDASPYSVGGFESRSIVDQYSQEIRLAAKQGPFDWIAGLYYYHDNLTQNTSAFAFTDPFFVDTPLFDVAGIVQNSPTQSSHNEAVFGDLRYLFAPEWTLDIGARYTRETKDLHAAAQQSFPALGPGFFPTIGGPGEPNSSLSDSWSAPTGRVAFEWRPMTGLMAYTSWSRGFKSGGYNGLAATSVIELGPYNPEKDNTYEIGVKSTWLDGRVTANLAVFYNKIKDLQVLYVDTIQGIPYFFVVNAASGTSKGAEFELRAQPGGGWSFSSGLGLLNTKYDSYVLPNGGPNYTGEEFVNAPKITGNVIAQYSFPLFSGTFGPNINFAYQGFRWTDNPHRPGIDDIPGYGLLGANLPWTTPNGRLQIALWGENLTNKHYYTDTVGNDYLTDGAAASYHGTPRTYGIRFGYTYR
jgi:iron complex outermembrane recepter protein